MFEHITTREAAQYVAEAGPRTAATITAHHLLYNRNAIFTGGIRPHYYCLPVLKREEHRRRAGRRGHVGQRPASSSAPTARRTPAHAEGARERLRRLLHRARARSSCTPRPSRRPARSTSSKRSRASTAPAFYGLPRNTGTVTLRKRDRGRCPRALPFGEAELKPLRGGETLRLAARRMNGSTAS